MRNDLNRTIGVSMLSEEVLKYLEPEIRENSHRMIINGPKVTFEVDAEGKHMSFQWIKNGQPIDGANEPTYVISEVNSSAFDGNYSVRVSNEFGFSDSEPTPLDSNGSLSHFTVPNLGIEMIWVKHGTFTMGSPISEIGRSSNELEHNVSFSRGFYLGGYEITQAQYRSVMAGNRYGLDPTPSNSIGDNKPVEMVSWNDIQIFLKRLNEIYANDGATGWEYVLPRVWGNIMSSGTTTPLHSVTH